MNVYIVLGIGMQRGIRNRDSDSNKDRNKIGVGIGTGTGNKEVNKSDISCHFWVSTLPERSIVNPIKAHTTP